MDDPSSLQYNAGRLLRVCQADREQRARDMGLRPQDARDCVRILCSWCLQQPHLPHQQLVDEMLLGHLLNKKFSIEKTKQIYDNYISARSRMPDLLMNRDLGSAELVAAVRTNRVVVLPELTQDKHRVVMLIPLSGPDWSLTSAIKLCIMTGEYRVMNDASLGEHVVVDLQSFRASDLVQCTPTIISKFLFYVQTCIGARLKGIHYVHAPPYFTPIINLIKKALKSKLLDRIYVHQTYDELMKFLPREIFPSDFGGDEITSDEIWETWLKTFEAPGWHQWFLDQDKVLADESKRLDKSNKLDDFFGVEGSFRQLTVD